MEQSARPEAAELYVRSAGTDRSIFGPYIVDFLCREARLIVEVDGATHSEDHEVAYDRRREAYLKREGYRIVRVLNNDVYTHINDVLEMILMSLEGKL